MACCLLWGERLFPELVFGKLDETSGSNLTLTNDHREPIRSKTVIIAVLEMME